MPSMKKTKIRSILSMTLPVFRWNIEFIVDCLEIDIICNGSTLLLSTKPICPSKETHWIKFDDIGMWRLEEMLKFHISFLFRMLTSQLKDRITNRFIN
jgi:hypothetical protein